MCKRVIRAVRAVLEEPEYRGRLAFEVYPWEHDKSSEARDRYEFGPDKHGLVVLSADGRLLTLRPGHSYGATEIRSDFDKALAPPTR
jgi:hypothetical protein